ncbi:TPA: hypothetical protein QFK82_001462 [Enterococcus faecium]|nr:hypothetical protein [Enterococcus sp. 2CBP]
MYNKTVADPTSNSDKGKQLSALLVIIQTYSFYNVFVHLGTKIY